jgi:putative DNA primase/helicase
VRAVNTEENKETPKDIDLDAAVNDFAKMKPLEFNRVLKDKALELGVSRPELDREVKRARKAAKRESDQDFLSDPAPWPEPVDGATLLEHISDAATSHIILPDGGSETIAFWALFDPAHNYFDISPLLTFTSPTPECGKTTALRFLQNLTTRPLSASNITAAAVYRAVEKWQPTLIVDEADTYLRDNDELRGILNSGHDRSSAFVIRTVGDEHEPKQFCTWAPKIVAMIGKLPATLASRSIHVTLKRMLPGDFVTPLRHTSHLEALRQKCIRWAADNAEKIANASDPEMPKRLYGRASDNWRPLLIIADVVGGDWPNRVRKIAELSSGRDSNDIASIQVLHDIAELFEDRGVDRLSSEEIVGALHEMEGRPWPEWGRARKPITKNQLANLLDAHSIVPGSVRLPSGKTPKGYHLRAFKDALTRYPPLETPQRHKPYGVTGCGFSETPQAEETDGVVAFQNDEKPLKTKACGAVAFQNRQSGEKNDESDPFKSLRDPNLKLRKGNGDAAV